MFWRTFVCPFLPLCKGISNCPVDYQKKKRCLNIINAQPIPKPPPPFLTAKSSILIEVKNTYFQPIFKPPPLLLQANSPQSLSSFPFLLLHPSFSSPYPSELPPLPSAYKKRRVRHHLCLTPHNENNDSDYVTLLIATSRLGRLLSVCRLSQCSFLHSA